MTPQDDSFEFWEEEKRCLFVKKSGSISKLHYFDSSATPLEVETLQLEGGRPQSLGLLLSYLELLVYETQVDAIEDIPRQSVVASEDIVNTTDLSERVR
ncbi:hypothetical protein TNCV_515541 [Trichonephila clavipes]|nr:hypothetical protein TNCV_515541 [Trichonephila clavipes]